MGEESEKSSTLYMTFSKNVSRLNKLTTLNQQRNTNKTCKEHRDLRGK